MAVTLNRNIKDLPKGLDQMVRIYVYLLNMYRCVHVKVHMYILQCIYIYIYIYVYIYIYMKITI
jgi:hypothetical protein